MLKQDHTVLCRYSIRICTVLSFHIIWWNSPANNMALLSPLSMFIVRGTTRQQHPVDGNVISYYSVALLWHGQFSLEYIQTCLKHNDILPTYSMMTWSNGNIFCITGPLCRVFTCDRWIFLTKKQWRGALMFSLICTWTNSWVNNRDAGDWILRCHHIHYDTTVMQKGHFISRLWRRPMKCPLWVHSLSCQPLSHCSDSPTNYMPLFTPVVLVDVIWNYQITAFYRWQFHIIL